LNPVQYRAQYLS